jgi:hypothetical protein
MCVREEAKKGFVSSSPTRRDKTAQATTMADEVVVVVHSMAPVVTGELVGARGAR